eukprot:3418100-Pleurochrysis_carterae.AAC.1
MCRRLTAVPAGKHCRAACLFSHHSFPRWLGRTIPCAPTLAYGRNLSGQGMTRFAQNCIWHAVPNCPPMRSLLVGCRLGAAVRLCI